MIIKFIGIFLISACLASFAVSIFIYAANRKKYYKLLEEFQKRNTLPAPYSFNCLIGYFGAAPMAYFFLGLMKKNRVFFLKRDSKAYDFFEQGNRELMKWMPAFYYSFLTSSILCALIAITGAALEIKNRYYA